MSHEHVESGSLSISNLLDVPMLQHLSDGFSKLTGIPTAMLDYDGTIVTASGWQRLCTDFHRKNPISAAKCFESDTCLANKLKIGRTFNVYQCRNGLVDIAVPLIVENSHIGNLFIGQFLFHEPDIDFFTRQAEELGVDKEHYLDALKEVPVIPREQAEQAVHFLISLTTIISSNALDRKNLFALNRELEKRIEKRTAQIQAEKNFSDSLINSLPGIMYVFDQSGNLLRWNSNFEVVTGYTEQQIRILKPLDFFATPEDKLRIAASIEKVFVEGSATVEADLLTAAAMRIPYLFTGYCFRQNDKQFLVGVGLDISERVRSEKDKELLIAKLNESLSHVKQLSGFLPICSSCKKIRDDEGYWNQIEAYLNKHSEAKFSHSLCPECAHRLYPDLKL